MKDMQRRKTEKIEEARILAVEKAAEDAEAADQGEESVEEYKRKIDEDDDEEEEVDPIEYDVFYNKYEIAETKIK